MKSERESVDQILSMLQERAKELVCLYQVDGILHSSEKSWEAKFRQILEAIPPGWQYPEVCQVRIRYGGEVFRTPRFKETPWVMEEPLLIGDDVVGGIEVSYAEERPTQAEGPFLEEERKLLSTLASHISFQLAHEELSTAWETWESTLQLSGSGDGGKWQVIIRFLERTDPQLLQRISRRMLHYLRWKGVEDLEILVKVTSVNGNGDEHEDDNRPVDLHSIREMPVPHDRVFQIATEHCSDCLLYTSPSPRDRTRSRMPSSA